MKTYNKKYIPFIYKSFQQVSPIKGKLILVDTLQLNDLFICTELYNMNISFHHIILSTTTDEDVRISRGNRSKYYIFKENKPLYHITKHY